MATMEDGMPFDEFPIRVFDRDSYFAIIERRLPHWSQAGTVCFITFRTADSMPEEVLTRWRGDRLKWLRDHGIDPDSEVWKVLLKNLAPRLQNEYDQMFSNRWHEELDRCYGECVFRDLKLARIVADSLKYFDGDRYELTDLVVMPNHVHLLAAFRDEGEMLKQCESWKHFTAREINRELGRKGRFWQQDDFDHLVRSVEQFEYLREYIRNNPRKAGLQPGEYIHESKRL